LAEFTQHASDAAPDLLQALADLTVTSRTIAEQRTAISELYEAVSGSSADLEDFLRANSGNIIELATKSRPSLDLLRRYAPAAPCVGAPRDGAGGGPRCPSVPYLPTGGGETKVLPAGGAPGAGGAAGGGLGPANSASENDLVNELTGPVVDEVPEELPDWSSVLVGPIYQIGRAACRERGQTGEV